MCQGFDLNLSASPQVLSLSSDPSKSQSSRLTSGSPPGLHSVPSPSFSYQALFAIVAFVLIIAAIVGNNLFGLFQQNVNFG